MADEQNRLSTLPPPLVALAGWLVPGAGYWIIGQRARGAVVCVTIIVLYLMGLLIAGVRVIEVPGYDTRTGQQIRILNGRRIPPDDRYYDDARWALTGGGFLSEIAGKPWFVGQIMAGPLCLGSAVASVQLARSSADYPRSHAPLETIGTLYTAIAGMLNLMVMIDAAHRAGQPASTAAPQEAA